MEAIESHLITKENIRELIAEENGIVFNKLKEIDEQTGLHLTSEVPLVTDMATMAVLYVEFLDYQKAKGMLTDKERQEEIERLRDDKIIDLQPVAFMHIMKSLNRIQAGRGGKRQVLIAKGLMSTDKRSSMFTINLDENRAIRQVAGVGITRGKGEHPAWRILSQTELEEYFPQYVRFAA